MSETKYRVRIVEYEGEPGCHHISDVPGFTGDNEDACKSYANTKLNQIMRELWCGPEVRKSIIEHMDPSRLRFYEQNPCVFGIKYDHPYRGKITTLFAAVINDVDIRDDGSLIDYLGLHASKFEDDWYITASSKVLDKIPQEESGSINAVLAYMDKHYPFC